jgi:hypothetical protein
VIATPLPLDGGGVVCSTSKIKEHGKADKSG